MNRNRYKTTFNSSAIHLLLAILIFGSSCGGQIKVNQEAAPSAGEETYVDPLFFIEGQLCQHLRRIFQYKNGDLWFGTNIYGLMRYDGHSLEYFDEKTGQDYSRITGFVQDSDSNMWFSSYNGLTKYDGQTFTDFKEKDGLLTNESWCVTIDSKGMFWIGTNEGISRFDGKSFTPFPFPKAEVKEPNTIYAENRVVSIVEDTYGNMWFGTDGFGICKYDGTNFTNYTTDDGLCDNVIHELKADSKGNLWIGTFYGGVCRFDGQKFTNYNSEGQVKGVEVSAFYEDKYGNMWFAAENDGVYQYDGAEFTNYSEKDGLNTNGILTIFEDREGRFWFGGWGGLFRFDGRLFVSVSKDGPWGR